MRGGEGGGGGGVRHEPFMCRINNGDGLPEYACASCA